MTRILVLGAGGDVGRGIVREAGARGWDTVAVSRTADPALFATLPTVRTVAADASSADGVAGVLETCPPAELDGVVVATSPTAATGPVLDMDPESCTSTITATLLPHLVSLRTFVPRLRPGALFLGLGGGMADLTFRGYGAISAAQAAERALYRNAVKENANEVVVRELMIRSMVAGDSNRDKAPEDWISDIEIGRAVCDLVIGHSEAGSGPMIELPPA